ncbi:MAG: hypothetical protein AC479_02205 [miscellaneous Crenarchaeota group-6 archaeon AD8-1]|nr:MAG: hypothetical protein AC479_02205 [miscellaneous Crenarchaeota group-6 archaeon AD8-1]
MKNSLIWQRKILSNNLRVLLYPRKSALTTQIGVGINYGANLDPDSKLGLAHFLEHMISGGSQRRINHSREIEFLGGISNFQTNHEYTYCFVDILPEKISEASKILSELLFDSTFEIEKLNIERKIILNELNDILDDPNEIIHYMLKECLFRNHPIKREIIGSKNSLKSLTISDLVQAHEFYYNLPNMILIITGRFLEKDIDDILNNFLSKNSSEIPFKRPIFFEKGKPKKSKQKSKAGINQTYIKIGARTVSSKHPDSHVLDLISTILGDGTSSRLFIKVREKLGLTYNISTCNDFGLDYGLFSIDCSVKPRKKDYTIKVVQKEVKKLCNEKVKETELQKAKDIIKSELLRIVDSPVVFPEFITSCEIKYETEYAILDYLKKISTTTSQDILEIAEKYLSENKLSSVALSPV